MVPLHSSQPRWAAALGEAQLPDLRLLRRQGAVSNSAIRVHSSARIVEFNSSKWIFIEFNS